MDETAPLSLNESVGSPGMFRGKLTSVRIAAMSASEDNLIFPEGASAELLTQARQKAIELLNRLLTEQAEVEWDPTKPKGDPQAAADWRQAMICAIESAKRAVAAIDAALKVAPGVEKPTGSPEEGHRWN